MPSLYSNYEYSSPIPVYARVKEELRSYFDTGTIDDLMFPLYTRDVLDKFRMSYYKIEHAYLDVCKHTSELPEDFLKIREAWLTAPVYRGSMSLGTAIYHLKDYRVTENDGEECGEDGCPANGDYVSVSLPEDMNSEYIVLHKLTSEVHTAYNRHILLRPGNVHAKDFCDNNYPDVIATSPYSFDIRDGKLWTSFDEGGVHLTYRAFQQDEKGNPLIPELDPFKKYLERYLKLKIYETLFNLSTDETFNQSFTKLQWAQKEHDLAWALLTSEGKRKTAYQDYHQIFKTRNRLNKYKL